jgi:hypothetical protein
LQRKRDLRLYAAAGAYFLFILCFPLMELLGLTFMDKLLDNIYPVDVVRNVKDHLR